jgi:hypothetical protein
MIRTTALAALLAVAATAANGQEAPPIRLELTPMAAPVPALKYYLYPEVRDQNPGNAVQLYYRAMNPESFGKLMHDSKLNERLVELGDKPLRDLKPAELKELGVVTGWKLLQDVDRGARRPNYDWELTDPLRKEGIALSFPDVQSMRALGMLLRARAKVELSERNFNGAARTLQTGLAMARHVANGPTLIQALVGVAIGSMMIQVLDDWVGLPDAPNLYWALTNLPHPLIDLRTGCEGERIWFDSLFPRYREMLADPTISPPSAQQLQKYAEGINVIEGPNSWYVLRLALQDYPEAKRLLRQLGRSAEQIEAMPVLHAVFLYEVYKYDVAYDDMRKSFGLPYPEAIRAAHQAEKRFLQSESPRRHDLVGELLPAVNRVLSAPARTERKFAALRCIEALRLYAAANGGKLPESLADITEVPIPVDPWSGKAFDYRVEGSRSFLSAPTPPEGLVHPNFSLRYELSIRPAKGEK